MNNALFNRWIAECCVTGSDETAAMIDLFQSWCTYAQAKGEYVWPGEKMRSFPSALKAAGFRRFSERFGVRGRGYRGLSLKEATH